MSEIIGPQDREAAVTRLSTAFADDLLEVSEFERRVTKVYEARTRHALVALTHDLPEASTPAKSRALARPEPRAIDLERAPRQEIRSVFSNIERDMRGPVPATLDVRSAFGNVELDLRDATFAPGVTEIHVRALAGNVEIELPDHVDIENDGRAVLGSFKVEQRRRRGDRDAPDSIVRISGRAFLSNVEIEVG